MPQDLINPARVDFVTRLFCAVAQSGSITQGARHCHLALSAASRRLSDFEAAARSCSNAARGRGPDRRRPPGARGAPVPGL